MKRRMSPRRLFLILVLALAVPAAEAVAADRPTCFSKEQQRAMIAAGQAVRLATVVRTVKRRYGGDVVRARLCEGRHGPVYLLTLLSRNGKVRRLSVDAVTGAIIGGR